MFKTISLGFFPGKGGEPLIITYRMTPKDLSIEEFLIPVINFKAVLSLKDFGGHVE